MREWRNLSKIGSEMRQGQRQSARFRRLLFAKTVLLAWHDAFLRYRERRRSSNPQVLCVGLSRCPGISHSAPAFLSYGAFLCMLRSAE